MPEYWHTYWEDFQFLRPWWLSVLPLLAIWFGWRLSWQQSAGWSRVIQKDKLAHLQVTKGSTRNLWGYFVSLAIGIVALAGPSSGLLPGSSGNALQVRVFVLDLSPSMLARDIAPDRLTIARLKLIDLLRMQQDQESALVVYADHAYQVTPLTDDPYTIEALVPTLHPAIMPAIGSAVESAVGLAKKLIVDGGYERGDIVLITDGIHADARETISRGWSADFRLSILAVGTHDGGPVPIADPESAVAVGGFLVDASQNVIIARTNSSELSALAKATGGRFSMATRDSRDVELIHAAHGWPQRIIKRDDDIAFDQRHDAGYWLALLLLPLALYAFRKNILWALIPVIVISPDSHAFEWQDLWLNKDQQAHRAFSLKDYETASRLFDNEKWKALSRYRLGQYGVAVELLASPEYADDFYNRGNAQALSGDPKAALVSYRIALGLYESDDKRKDTLYNIRVLRHLLDQMSQQEEEQPRGGDAAGEGVQGGEVLQAGAQEQAAAEGEQFEVGGAVGSGSTLQQQALQENSSSDSVSGDPDSQTANDASVAPQQSVVSQSFDNPEDSSSEELAVEDNENKVLSPYSEQWLKELPADPGGYLRRKFGYQAQLRQANIETPNQTTKEVRY